MFEERSLHGLIPWPRFWAVHTPNPLFCNFYPCLCVFICGQFGIPIDRRRSRPWFSGQRLKFGPKHLAHFRSGHGDEDDLPTEAGDEVGVAGAVLAFEAFGPGAVEDRPEAPDLRPGHAGVVVNHQARHELRRAPAEDAGLRLVDIDQRLNPSDDRSGQAIDSNSGSTPGQRRFPRPGN